MNLSMNWLRDFVGIDCDVKEFTEKMTMSGSKVETYEEFGKLIDKIVVGKVLKIDRHPDADRLVVCSVDVNEKEPLQIVTAAKNLKVGNIVPVALNGSTLADGRKIKKGKLRGILSQGMMCSLDELGCTKDLFPYAIEDGIFVLQEECKLGQDIKSAIGINDVKVEFEITSNRPDCYSMIGLAREVAATFNKKLNIKNPEIKGTKTDKTLLDVEVIKKDECLLYSARIVRGVKVKQSPKWIRERLIAMGVRPINNVVDVTNYVMLEYGQPMHAFDLSLIDGNKIIVRHAQEKEKITLLDKTTLELTKDDLVISDENKPIALAGIMGGANSAVSEKTTDIVFESACFKSSKVRQGSQKHGIKTESSFRFERGIDVNTTLTALKRACELIEQITEVKEFEKVVCYGDHFTPCSKVELDCDFINLLLGTNLSEDEIVSILEKVGCTIKDKQIIVPTYRTDLKCKADIAEEVARFYGYNKIESSPLNGCTQGTYSLWQRFKKKTVNTLLALGLDEIMTDSFMDPADYDKLLLPLDSPLRQSVEIRNPLGKTSSTMRSIALPAMLYTLSRNYNNKNCNVKVFEVAKEYIKINDDDLPDEKEKLVAGIYGSNLDFFDIKGILEEFLDAIDLKNYDINPLKQKIEYYHPGRSAQITVNENLIGTIGQIHPKVCNNFDIECPVYLMYIDMDLLFKNISKEIKYKKLPKFPSVTRDLCLICDEEEHVSTLTKIISNSIGDLLESITLFDVYSGKQIPQGKKSVAFNITLRSHNSTLEDKQISSVMDNVINSLEQNGVTLRK